jgi:hypothetical protein
MPDNNYTLQLLEIGDVLPTPRYATAWASLGFILERFLVRETPSPTFLIRIALFISRSIDRLHWLQSCQRSFNVFGTTLRQFEQT